MTRTFIAIVALTLAALGAGATPQKEKHPGGSPAVKATAPTVEAYVSRTLDYLEQPITDIASLDAELQWAQEIVDGPLRLLIDARYPDAADKDLTAQLAAVANDVESYFDEISQKAFSTADLADFASDKAQYALFCQLAEMNRWLRNDSLQANDALKKFCLQLLLFEEYMAELLTAFTTTENGGGSISIIERPLYYEFMYRTGAKLFSHDINAQIQGLESPAVSPETAMARLLSNYSPDKLEEMKNDFEMYYKPYKQLYDIADDEFEKLLAACRAWTRAHKRTGHGIDGTRLENLLTPFIIEIAD